MIPIDELIAYHTAQLGRNDPHTDAYKYSRDTRAALESLREAEKALPVEPDLQDYVKGWKHGTYINALYDYATELRAQLSASMARVKELEAKLKAVREDAERYRWLRDGVQGAQSADGKAPLVVMDEPTRIPRYIGPLAGKHLDAAIDKAMTADKGEK